MAEVHGKIEVLSMTLNRTEDKALIELLLRDAMDWDYIGGDERYLIDIFMYDNPDGLGPELKPEHLKAWRWMVKEIMARGELEWAVIYIEGKEPNG